VVLAVAELTEAKRVQQLISAAAGLMASSPAPLMVATAAAVAAAATFHQHRQHCQRRQHVH
jgi:hypothetical protein